MYSVEKRGNIFILTLTGEDEHCFNPTSIANIRSVIADIKSQAASSSAFTALITTATGKFFCNGVDVEWVESHGPSSTVERIMHVIGLFMSVVADIMSLPMPTIAAVSGHAATGGFVLARSHDYLLMQKDKGVLYMSELDNGFVFPKYFRALFREKLGSPAARREMMLRAAKLKGKEALELGVVDSVYDSREEMVEAALRLGEQLTQRKWNGKVYSEIRKSMYPELCMELGLTRRAMVLPKL